jgi:DNA-binding winged helix-turn-helix (wHTH) protein
MQSTSVVRFGVFELDLRAGELHKHGLKIKLQDQPFQILVMLLEQPGQVVTREQLHQKLWAEGTFVDFEHGLNAAIQRLRQALGDTADNPRFVETLARRGYRFVAPVDSGKETGIAPIATKGQKSRLPWAIAGTAVLLAAAGFGLWLLRPAPHAAARIVPLTSYPGRQITPAFSPDGKQVAFAWDGEDGENFDIYCKACERRCTAETHEQSRRRVLTSLVARWPLHRFLPGQVHRDRIDEQFVVGPNGFWRVRKPC